MDWFGLMMFGVIVLFAGALIHSIFRWIDDACDTDD